MVSLEINKEKLPLVLRKEIYKYKNGCAFITDEGKRCSKAFNYIDNQGNKLNCEGFCLKNCNKWIDNVIDNLPVSAKVNDIKVEIQQISFTFDDDDKWTYLWKDDEWVDKDKNEIDKKNVKAKICSKIKNLVDSEFENYFMVFIVCRYDENDERELTSSEDEVIELSDKDGNRWFTPKWELDFLSATWGYNKLSLSKIYYIK